MAIVSAGGVAASRTRGLVRSASEQLESAMRRCSGTGTEVVAQIHAAVSSCRGRHEQAVWRDLSFLVACVSERHVVVVATTGVRCYRFRNGALAEITSEQSPCPSPYVDDVVPGDAYVMCTDGIHGVVSEGRMLSALRADYHPRDVAWAIADVARAAERDADMTAVIVRPLEGEATTASMPLVAPHRSSRFSDEQLALYRHRLEALLAEIRAMRARLVETNPTGFSARRFATRTLEVREALARLNDDVFGRCVRCDSEIDATHLDARPDEPRCPGCSG